MRRLFLIALAFSISLSLFASQRSYHSSRSHSSRGYRTYSSHSHRSRSYRSHRATGYSPRHRYRRGYIAPGYTLHPSVQRDSHGRIKRSEAAKDAFKRQQPCPSTGRRSGACPGYVIDHVDPLECGGADAPTNMQWQTVADSKAKDKTERYCR